MKSKQRQLEEELMTLVHEMVDGWENGGSLEGMIDDVYHASYALRRHITQITDKAGAFVPGSSTSENAAVTSRLTVGSVRRRIVDEIRAIGLHSSNIIGLTDDELERRVCRPHTTVSSARNWLCNNGWLEDSGFTRMTQNRREATVWRLTPAAQAQVASPEWVERSKA